MNSRERLLSLVLILFIGLFITGFLTYLFVLQPIQEATTESVELEAKIDEMEQREMKVLKDLKVYEQVDRKMSLPADVDLARREYGIQLESLLRKSSFAANAIKVTPRPADTRTAPLLAAKKPAYTKLLFDITVTGELTSFVEFLEYFYRQPLLHQIKSMTVQRPAGNNERRRNPNEMEITIIVEALVLDRAEARATLAPVPTGMQLLGGGVGSYGVGQIGILTGKGAPYHLDPVLATPARQYASITGKNIFFGPPPPAPKREVAVEETPKEPDISPFIKLVGISNDGGVFTASFFDLYNKQDHKITQKPDGSIKVESFYYTGDTKKRIIPAPKFFEFGTAEGGNLRQFRVARVLDGEVLLQEVNEDRDKKLKFGASLIAGGVTPQLVTDKTLMVTVGSSVKDAQLLTSREARQLLLGGTPAPAPAAKKPEL